MEENHQLTSKISLIQTLYFEFIFNLPTSSAVPQSLSKRSKDRKKKKLKSTIQASTSTIADDRTPPAPETKIDEKHEKTAGMLNIDQCFLRIFTFE